MPYSYTGTRTEGTQGSEVTQGASAMGNPVGWNDEATRLEELYLEEQNELRDNWGALPGGQQPVSLAILWFTHANPPISTMKVNVGVLFVPRALRAGEFSGVMWVDSDRDREWVPPVGGIIYAVPVSGLRPLWLKLKKWTERTLNLMFSPGADPAANELDPDSEDEGRGTRVEGGKTETVNEPLVIGEYFGCVVDAVVNLPPWDAQDETFQRCHKEGREYAEGLLRGGSTVPEIRRNSIAPCPHPLGVPQRTWWIQGLLAVLNDAEMGAAA